MSLATRQALVQLAVVAGCFNTLKQGNSFARVDIRRLIDQALLDITEAVINWPCTGDEKKNAIWIKHRLARWQEFIEADPDEHYGSIALAKMAERIIFALDEVTANAYKRQLLQPIYQASCIINAFCDKDGAHYPAYEKSDFLLRELYEIIELREYALVETTINQRKTMKIYISSSWKNRENVRCASQILRNHGHEVYDFTDSNCRKTPEIPPERFPEQFDPEKHIYSEYLDRPEWRNAVEENKKAIEWCDAVMLLLPCGVDATADWAYGVGLNKMSCVVGCPAKGERSPVHLWADKMFTGFGDALSWADMF